MNVTTVATHEIGTADPEVKASKVMKFSFYSKRQGCYGGPALGCCDVKGYTVLVDGENMVEQARTVDETVEVDRILFVPEYSRNTQVTGIGHDLTQCRVASFWMIGI